MNLTANHLTTHRHCKLQAAYINAHGLGNSLFIEAYSAYRMTFIDCLLSPSETWKERIQRFDEEMTKGTFLRFPLEEVLSYGKKGVDALRNTFIHNPKLFSEERLYTTEDLQLGVSIPYKTRLTQRRGTVTHEITLLRSYTKETMLYLLLLQSPFSKPGFVYESDTPTFWADQAALSYIKQETLFQKKGRQLKLGVYVHNPHNSTLTLLPRLFEQQRDWEVADGYFNALIDDYFSNTVYPPLRNHYTCHGCPARSLCWNSLLPTYDT